MKQIVYYDKNKGFIDKKEANKDTIILEFKRAGYDFKREQTKYKLFIKKCLTDS